MGILGCLGALLIIWKVLGISTAETLYDKAGRVTS
jgi:hypothetical protein